MKLLILYTQHAVARVLLGVIEGYRLFVSPLSGANCRHLPTCSQYAKDAVIIHGPLRGSYYTLKRILRCHPWAKSMHDPVPPVNELSTSAEYTDSKNQRLGE
ncbi:membrane protein insertion efficiency factor YidD [Candidatus Puniceispirillum sp.]|nr:membrane protein insertion efficiency factor YidD [Candidatus Puniceispirillum sp.]